MKPYLVLDCYLDPDGGAHNFLPHVHPRPSAVIRRGQPTPADATGYAGLVITGSAASCVVDPPPWVEPFRDLVRDASDRGLPILGVCFGHQLLAQAVAGPGAVRRAAEPEVGWPAIRVHRADPILAGFGDPFRVFVSHEDEVVPDVPGIQVLASSPGCAVQVLRIPGRPQWGVQFHSEMTFAEQVSLVRYRAERHPELGLDPDAMIAGAVDASGLVDRLFANFFRALE